MTPSVDVLAHTDPIGLLALLTRDGRTNDPVVAVLRRCGSRAAALTPSRRLGMLALTAAQFGLTDLRERLTAAGTDPFRPLWAHRDGPAHLEICGHPRGPVGVALGQVGERAIIVSGCPHDTAVRVWDAATGQPIGSRPHTAAAVAVGRLAGRAVIVSGGTDHAVRIWDATTGTPVGPPHRRPGMVRAMALGRPDGRPVIVSGGEYGLVVVWDAATGEPIGPPLDGHAGPVTAVALGRLGGRDVIVSGGADSTVRVCDVATRRPVQVLDLLHPVRSVRIHDGRLYVSAGSTCAFIADPDAVTAARKNFREISADLSIRPGPLRSPGEDTRQYCHGLVTRRNHEGVPARRAQRQGRADEVGRGHADRVPPRRHAQP